MLCDRMCYHHKMISIFRHGINSDDIGPIAKASFEETPEMFLKAARHAELDFMRGVSSNVMCGQTGYFGTSAFQVLADINEMMQQEPTEEFKQINTNDLIESSLKDMTKPTDTCSVNNLTIDNNIVNINSVNMGDDDDYDIEF